MIMIYLIVITVMIVITLFFKLCAGMKHLLLHLNHFIVKR